MIIVLIFAPTTVLWAVSLRNGDASIIDIFWGPGFALAAWAGAALAPHLGLRAWLVLALVTLWGLRLGLHIFLRHKGEDHRYATMRRAAGPRWWWRSLFQVFWLQALLICFISLPIQFAIAATAPATMLDGLGAAIALAGLAIETMADRQLTRFRADPASKGAVMDRGLWAWSRHPNYFGDALMWWGYFLIGLAASHAWWTMLCPAMMTFLLLRVSGVALLESAIAERRPAYADYIRRTSAFVPLPPARKARNP
ncbi:MAG: DUF1295 domain-containing protein [Rhizomicrobium sp.]